MGWCSGNELADVLYNAIRFYIPKEYRKEVASQFYEKFCDYDADDWDGTSKIELDIEGELE